MRRHLPLLAFCLVYLTAQMSEAAVGINSQQTFGAAPPVADWSTRSVPQTAGTTPSGSETTTAAQMDAIVQTNTAAMINGAVTDQAGTAASGAARRNTAGAYVFTRPTGNTATILMVTLVNSSGGNFPSPTISYDLGIPDAIASEDAELAGHRVYYSLTGLANSWTLIPGLTTTTPAAGPVSTTLSLGTWAANSLLYVIWVDDNGAGGGDGSFSIDNFLVSAGIPCPTISQQPSNTNTLVGRTVSLSVVATGPALTYQWSKVGSGPIDTTANPSAATATLVISNAQSSDTGDYNVTVANSCGPVSSASAHIEILPDTFPPRFLSARVVTTNQPPPDLNHFLLITDEQLCSGEPSCGENSLFSFFWRIAQADNELLELGISSINMINPTTYEFVTSDSRDPSKAYRIYADDFGSVRDLSGNGVPPGTFAEAAPEVTAISVGATGSVLYTFDEAPEAKEFATFNWGGGANGTVDTVDTVNTKVAAHKTIRLMGCLRFIVGC